MRVVRLITLRFASFFCHTVDMANNRKEQIALLGRIVKKRREQLGMSQKQLLDNGGPSNSTLTGIENGTTDVVSNATLRKLDESLNWKPGAARGILEYGEEPEIEDLPDPRGWSVPSVQSKHVTTDQVISARRDGLPLIQQFTDRDLLDELGRRLTASDEMRTWLMKQAQDSSRKVEELEAQLSEMDDALQAAYEQLEESQGAPDVNLVDLNRRQREADETPVEEIEKMAAYRPKDGDNE